MYALPHKFCAHTCQTCISTAKVALLMRRATSLLMWHKAVALQRAGAVLFR